MEEKTLSDVPFMKNPVTMLEPHKYFANFLKQNDLYPKCIMEIGGGKEYNMKNFFDATYINFDFSEDISSDTIVKDIVNDDISEFYNMADVVYTNNTFEHISNPFIAAEKIYYLLKKGGIIFIRSPFSYSYHPCPNDYWRFSPVGLQKLFPKLHILESGMDQIFRRTDDRGSFKNGLDKVLIDSLGGWRERWHSYIIGKK